MNLGISLQVVVWLGHYSPVPSEDIRLSHHSSISLHGFWFRYYRPFCRFSLFIHCLRADHPDYTSLADTRAHMESNLTHYLCNISGVRGGSNSRFWSRLENSAGSI